MKFFALFVAILLAIAPLHAQTTRPVPQIAHAVMISVDGLRPDVLLRADAPRIRRLIDGGAFTFWARSTVASITLPTHVSLLTGMTPEGHGIVWNGDLPLSEPVYPKTPTIFELAKKAGYTTACVTGKSKFSLINKPGTIDFAWFPDESKTSDADVVQHAQQILRSRKPGVMFIHFPGVDSVGHSKGWGTPEQLAAITETDKCIGQIVDALAELGLTDSTVIILTADHGGAGRTHGAEDVRSRHIPWIVAGPGIRKGYDLTNNRELTVEVYDTFTTVCALLDIKIGRKVNGKFVEEILEQRELLK